MSALLFSFPLDVLLTATLPPPVDIATPSVEVGHMITEVVISVFHPLKISSVSTLQHEHDLMYKVEPVILDHLSLSPFRLALLLHLPMCSFVCQNAVEPLLVSLSRNCSFCSSGVTLPYHFTNPAPVNGRHTVDPKSFSLLLNGERTMLVGTIHRKTGVVQRIWGLHDLMVQDCTA